MVKVVTLGLFPADRVSRTSSGAGVISSKNLLAEVAQQLQISLPFAMDIRPVCDLDYLIEHIGGAPSIVLVVKTWLRHSTHGECPAQSH